MSVPSFIKGQLFVTPPEPKTRFSGQTVIVTGSNSGLGLECVKHLVKLDVKRVILACRSLEKGNAAKKQIYDFYPSTKATLEVWLLDMAQYKSILEFAGRCKSLDRLDAVVGNAGILAHEFSKAELDEATITVNVVSAALLSILLLPKLQESAEKFNIIPHISVVSSVVHAFVKTKDLTAVPTGKIFRTLSEDTTANMLDRYNLSKLLVLLCMRELAERTKRSGKSRVIINNPAPGWVKTELFRDDYKSWSATQKLAYKTIARPSDIASRTLVHGISAGAESHGQWLSECVVKPASSFVRSQQGEKFQQRLWIELMDKLVKISPEIESMGL